MGDEGKARGGTGGAIDRDRVIYWEGGGVEQEGGKYLVRLMEVAALILINLVA